MGYVVFHMQKTHGTDSGTSAHIERKVKPSNADEERTCLNRYLPEMLCFALNHLFSGYCIEFPRNK